MKNNSIQKQTSPSSIKNTNPFKYSFSNFHKFLNNQTQKIHLHLTNSLSFLQRHSAQIKTPLLPHKKDLSNPNNLAT